MATFSKIQAGQTLYDVHRYKMGNTTASDWGVWPVKIVSIDHVKGTAVGIWNGNVSRPRVYTAQELTKLAVKDPTCEECYIVRGHKRSCSKRPPEKV